MLPQRSATHPASAPADSESWPAHQRRRYYRAAVGQGSDVRVRVWSIPPGFPIGHRPMPSWEIKVLIREFSVGGLSVVLPGTHGVRRQISLTDRLRIEICQGNDQLLVEGRIRINDELPEADGSMRAGIPILDHQVDPESSGVLARIAGRVQRAELKSGQTPGALPTAHSHAAGGVSNTEGP